MTRRLALAWSFALTLVVSFAVATLGASAGWFRAGEASSPDAALVPAQLSTTQTPFPTTIVTPETIIVDIPVVTVPVPQQPVSPQPYLAQKAPVYATPVDRNDDFDHNRHGGRGRDHPEDD
jgi:hypothetical protein